MKTLKIAFLFLCVTGFAQTKVGTVDVDFVLSKMPDLAGVQKQVNDYGAKLEADLTKKYEEYNAMVEDYKATEITMTIAQKKVKQDTILSRENEIAEFQQNGNRLIGLQREQFLQPLYKKIGDALEKIAKAEGYTQILLRNNNIVYVDNRYDLTLSVLKELGIELKEGE